MDLSLLYMPAKYWVLPSMLNNLPSTVALGPPLKRIGTAGEAKGTVESLLVVDRAVLYTEVGAPFTRFGSRRRDA